MKAAMVDTIVLIIVTELFDQCGSTGDRGRNIQYVHKASNATPCSERTVIIRSTMMLARALTGMPAKLLALHLLHPGTYISRRQSGPASPVGGSFIASAP